jgi:hypothetical protein
MLPVKKRIGRLCTVGQATTAGALTEVHGRKQSIYVAYMCSLLA